MEDKIIEYGIKLNNQINKILNNYDNIPIYKNGKQYEKINIKDKGIRNIILSGGGIKGFAHIGALKALEDNNINNCITTIAGTSIGAIISLLYVIGYTPDEMYETAIKLNMKEFKNINFSNLLNEYGLDNGKRITNLLSNLMKKKRIKKNITFLELYEKTGINLIVTGVCINNMKAEYFSHESHPKMKVINAIRISFSIPGYFTPAKYKKKMYIDGACIDNYPIHLFDNDETIGIYLYSSSNYINEFNNLEEYFTRIIQCLIEGFDTNSTRNYSRSTIKIDLEQVGMLDFDINIEEINKIKQIGYNSTYNYLKNNNLL